MAERRAEALAPAGRPRGAPPATARTAWGSSANLDSKEASCAKHLGNCCDEIEMVGAYHPVPGTMLAGVCISSPTTMAGENRQWMLSRRRRQSFRILVSKGMLRQYDGAPMDAECPHGWSRGSGGSRASRCASQEPRFPPVRPEYDMSVTLIPLRPACVTSAGCWSRRERREAMRGCGLRLPRHCNRGPTCCGQGNVVGSGWGMS
jgi:hypothetical protein